MIYSNAKAQALLRDLGQRLSVRLANNSGLNTVSNGFYTDANGAVWPYILVSNASAGTGEGNAVVYIEISCIQSPSPDIFGNTLYAYAPELLQLGYELSSGGAPIPARADILVCEYEALATGVRIQLKEVANGTAVTGASVNAAAAVADLDNLYFPTKNP